jgi:hypothetical protein
MLNQLFWGAEKREILLINLANGTCRLMYMTYNRYHSMMRQRKRGESTRMSANERDDLAAQVNELQSDVRHLQSEIRIMDQRIERVDKRTDALQRSFFIWAFGFCIALTGALFYALARGFKWI